MVAAALPAGFAAGEPADLDSVQAATALVDLAGAAFLREDGGTAARLLSRLFLELHPRDLRDLLQTLTGSWLQAMLQSEGPRGMAEAALQCQQGIAAALEKRFSEAAGHFIGARGVWSDRPRANPMAAMLALGAERAAQRVVEIERRETRLQELVVQASRLMVTPGHKSEAQPLLHQALALLDPTRPQDRERAEKIGRLLRELETSPEQGAATGPAAVLPLPGALEPAAWDDLGMQFMVAHPAHAKVCFERAIAAAPDSGVHWLHLAATLTVLEAEDEAILDAYRRAARLSPGEIRAWVGFAAALQETGRYAEAIGAWDVAIRLAPDAERPRSMRAFCGEAEALVREGATFTAAEWSQRGMLLLDQRAWALADLAFSRCLVLAPRDLDAWCGKGLANVRWAQALKAEDNDAALLRFRIGRDAMRSARQIDPGNVPVARVLELCARELPPE